VGEIESLRGDLVRAWLLAGYLPRPARDQLRETLAKLGRGLAELAWLGELVEMFGDRTLH
jgi:hypothetical protein